MQSFKAAVTQTRRGSEKGKFKRQVQIHTLIDLLIQYLSQHLTFYLTIKNNTETKILRERKGRGVEGEGELSEHQGPSFTLCRK